MKTTHDKVLICNICYYRLACDDIRYGENLCLLYKKSPKIRLYMHKNANTWYQKIDAQDTIEFNNDELKLLYKKL